MKSTMQTVIENREFVMTDGDFETIRNIVSERSGIVLSDGKRDMVYGRLVKRLRILGLSGFNQYCDVISRDDESELSEFINAITTNLTAFFRESHHFEFLQKEVLPHIIKTKKEKKIRIWSAGCSSGEEPYSIAMIVRETVPRDWDIKILATDLDTNMVNKANAGIYDEGRVSGIDKKRLKRWIKKGKGRNSNMIRMSDELRNIIIFKQLNLMQDWPFNGPFDFMFCRNVVIYFNKDTQRILFDRFANLLNEDSYIFIGHSESMFNICDRFKLLGKTIYKKQGI